MADKVITDYPQLELFTLECEPQTLEAERRELADILDGNTVVLLIGTDTLKTIAGWKDVELFLSDHELCVGIRDDETIDSIKADISSIEEELGVKIKYYVATIPHKAISSTKIRSAPGYNSL